jgi:hypothetical protein
LNPSFPNDFVERHASAAAGNISAAVTNPEANQPSSEAPDFEFQRS